MPADAGRGSHVAGGHVQRGRYGCMSALMRPHVKVDLVADGLDLLGQGPASVRPLPLPAWSMLVNSGLGSLPRKPSHEASAKVVDAGEVRVIRSRRPLARERLSTVYFPQVHSQG